MIAFLASGGPFLMADLYTIALANGTTYYWTSAGQNITANGNTFLATTDQGNLPILSRGAIQQDRGLGVSVLDLTVYTEDTAQILGINFAMAAHNGALDGGLVTVQRAMMSVWGTTTNGTITLFQGLVGGLDVGSTQTVLHVNSLLENLQTQKMPRLLMQPQCTNGFGDANCGISLAGVTGAGTVTSGSTTTAISGAPTKPTQYYQNGVMVFTSGVNTGARRAISSYAGGILVPTIPLLATPGVGDTFTIYPGCAKTKAACSGFWGVASTAFVALRVYQITALGTTTWTSCGAPAGAAVGTVFTATGTAAGTGTAWDLGHFRGFPYTPVPETSR